jgi:hypothetical protein
MNKRTMILSLVAVFATTLLLTALMFTTSAAPAGSPRATGGGTTEEDGEKSTFVFNAIQNKNGTVNGHLVYTTRYDNIRTKMDIDCLNIVGNNAIMSGVITEVKGDNIPAFIFVGQRAEFQVEDNGEGGDDAPDLISNLNLGPNASCNLIAPTPYLPIDGNIQVQP